MEVIELIEELKKASPGAIVYISVADGNGCDTCGYGETSTETDINDVEILGDKVWIIPE